MKRYSIHEVKNFFNLSDEELRLWRSQGLLVPQTSGWFGSRREFFSEYQLNVIERLLEEQEILTDAPVLSAV